jgi:transposase
MFKIPRQSYTAEFKRVAIKMVEAGQCPAEVARQPGVSEQTLNNWRKAAAAGRLAASSKVVSPAQMELSRLRAENQRLKIENEILKKPRRPPRGFPVGHTLRRNRCEVRLD